MKPSTSRLVVCVASGTLKEALPRIERWRERSTFDWPLVLVENGGVTDRRPSDGHFLIERRAEWLGSVPAMALAVRCARTRYAKAAEVIVALHDDVEILEDGWDAQALEHFARHPRCGSAGFSGAFGLGSSDIYVSEYAPMQLARQGFVSNLVDAHAHGARAVQPLKVVCHDGFALLGRASWWFWGQVAPSRAVPRVLWPPWDALVDVGMRHHAYDSAMGLLAQMAGWESWFLPIACQHLGGRTAVANPDYQAWAQRQVGGGDQGFWEQAHRALYEMGRGYLPLRVG